MTNLRRYNLGSATDIHWYEALTGNVCDAPEALAIIEALQAEVAAKDARIERLLAELEAAHTENATLAGLVLDATNIFSYTEPVE